MPVVVREFARELLVNACEIRLRTAHIDAALHTAHDVYVPARSTRVRQLWRVAEKRSHLGARKEACRDKLVERCGQDANHLIRRAVNGHRLASDGRIAVEPAPPERVAEKNLTPAFRMIVLPFEVAAEGWCDAQRAKELPRDPRPDESFCVSPIAADRRRPAADGRHPIEGCLLRSQAIEREVPGRTGLIVSIVLLQEDNAVGCRI